MTPNIFYINPYAVDMCYGKQLNKHIECFPKDAWICITDQDVLFLSPNSGRLIHNAIMKYPDTDLFTCQTNRLGNPKRCYNNTISQDSNILSHTRIANVLERELGHECSDLEDRTVAGMFMLFPKRVWLDNKFDNHPIIHEEDNKITSFDVRWTNNIKGTIKRINGLYVWHTYRLDRELNDVAHLEN